MTEPNDDNAPNLTAFALAMHCPDCGAWPHTPCEPHWQRLQLARLEEALARIKGVKRELREAMGGLHPVQIMQGDHDLAPDTTFNFTAAQLLDFWETLNHASTEIHFAAGHGFRIAATGRDSEPLSSFMPHSVLPEVEGFLTKAG